MCGISLTINGTIAQTVAMGESIKHRGTRHNLTEIDNIKVWFSCLPITDATAPMQPFINNGKYFWLNGFISNYKELAEKYKIELTTNCDTELLSKFPGKYDELNGFFSIVIYDSVSKKLDCFTDRYGCKQLYKYQTGDTSFICSEVKGIAKVVDLKLDPYAVDDWLYSLGTMTKDTVFKNIKRVEPLPFNHPKSISISYPDAKKRLLELLDQSIKRNKVIGINDGVFLSGGVDSGYLANRLKPDYCFSMDYVDKNYSESANIKLNSTGTHLSMICNEDLFNKYKEKTFLALDDLKAGSSYTNFALTELAAKHCTVIYSGAGGDELFDGYTHRYERQINDVIRRTGYKIDAIPVEMTHKQYDWAYLKSILVVEDRMSGFHTMETRYPFLDNDLVDFVLSIPAIYKVNKRILKDVCGLHEDVVKSPKKGFSNPYVDNLEWAMFAMECVTSSYVSGNSRKY